MRIVMLTLDSLIDRRILQEAETLIDMGHEVIVLGATYGTEETFERIGDVKIERCKYRETERLLTWHVAFLTGIQNRTFSVLNRISGRAQRFFAGQVIKTNDRFTRLHQSGVNQKVVDVAAPALMRWRGFLVFALNATLGALALTGRAANEVTKALARAVAWLPIKREAVVEVMKKRAVFYNPDVVHAHDLPCLKTGVALKRRFDVPLVYDAHELYPEQPRLTPQSRRKWARTERRYVYRADSVITVNQPLAEIMAQRYPGIDVTVIQNAVVPGDASIDRKPDRFREEYGIAAGAVILLFQGLMASGRNLETLVRGMARTDDRFVLVLMGYAGSEDYVDGLKALAADSGAAERIVFVPRKERDELLSYTASADVGLIPYPYGQDLNTHYCSPNKLYEYISACLPILANRLPFVEDVVRSNGFGYCADMQSEPAFAEAVNGLRLETLREIQSRMKADKHLYEWPHESQKLVGVYRGLLGEAADREGTGAKVA